MKRLFRLFGFIASLIAGLFGWSGKAFAPPTTVTISKGLQWGSLYGCNNAGTAILAPTGTVSTTGCILSFGGTVQGGLAFVKGNGTHMGSVTGTYTLQNTTGSTMSAKTFKFSTPSGSFLGTTTFTYLPQGNTKIVIGATLHIKAAQPQGIYNGTFTMNWNKI